MTQEREQPCPICFSSWHWSCSRPWSAASCRAGAAASFRFGATALALLGLLAGCGGLPRPFQGNPGALGLRLSQPPPPRLAVPLPGKAFLKPPAARIFAADLAAALVAKELPVQAGPARKGEWQVVPSVQTHDAMVLPTYTVEDARGVEEGVAYGTPMPAGIWIAADPQTLLVAAQSAAPAITRMLEQIDARLKQSDPNSLLNRPPRIAFAGVSGAPGDGDQALARLMRGDLTQLGLMVQPDPAGADYRLTGTVKLSALKTGHSLIEITWIVDNPAGVEQGRVSQLHDIVAGSLDQYWGDVALVVAQEAASGVKTVIANQINAPKPASHQPAS